MCFIQIFIAEYVRIDAMFFADGRGNFRNLPRDLLRTAVVFGGGLTGKNMRFF